MVDFGFEYCQEMLSHIVGSGMWEGMSAPLVRAVRRVERVEKPVIDPFTAMITGSTEISITSATSGAEIIYTLDGSVPTPNNGTILSNGGTIMVTSSIVVKAIAYQPGWLDSAVSISRFNVADIGSLKVTLVPGSAVFAGAQWRLDEGEWQNSGTTTTNLSVGQYSITYKSIDNWSTPNKQDVTIKEGQTTVVYGNYTSVVTVEPNITVTPESLDFGTVVIDGGILSKLLTVTNQGVVNLELDNLIINGNDAADFSILNDNCSLQTLPPGESQTVQIVFDAKFAGLAQATITIPSNDPDTPNLEIELTGTGIVDINNIIYIRDDNYCDNNSPCYDNIGEGYLASYQEGEIKISDGLYTEDLIFCEDINITLTGGWNTDYNDNSAGQSTISGSLTISAGTVTVEGLVLTGCISCDLNKGLVAYYPFNGNANDESGNGIDGTVHGATLTKDNSGVTNKAYHFDGDWDYIEAGSTSDFNLIHNGSDFTISIWEKHDTSIDRTSGLLGNDIGGDRKGFFLNVTERNVYFAVGRTSPYPVVGKYWENVLPRGNNWNNLTVTFNSTSNQYNLFVNGVNVNEPVVPIHPHLDGNAFYTLKIGTSKTVPSYGWATADIDELRIYNRTLSDSEISELYNGSFSEGKNITNYHEDFSSDPNFTSHLSSNVESKCSAQWIDGCYRVTVDDQNADWWCFGQSPEFLPFSPDNDFTIQFDLNPTKTAWGEYPGIYFFPYAISSEDELRNLSKESYIMFQCVWADSSYDKMRFNLGGQSYRTSAIPAKDEWYHISIEFHSLNATADLSITREDGTIFYSASEVSAPISGSFKLLAVGEYGSSPAYGSNATINIDNIYIRSSLDNN